MIPVAEMASKETSESLLPTAYPFVSTTPKGSFPASDWSSHSQSTHTGTRSRRKASPRRCRPQAADALQQESDIITPSPGNRPHPQLAFHIVNIHQKKVCDVTSSLRQSRPSMDTPVTESRANYTRKEHPTKPEVPKSCRHKKASGIVPSCSSPKIERLLPVCTRDSSTTMASDNPLQYVGSKRKARPSSRTKDGAGRPRPRSMPAKDRRSLNDLNAGEFTRRRQVHGPQDALHVNGFDGGAVPKQKLKPSLDLWYGYTPPNVSLPTVRALRANPRTP